MRQTFSRLLGALMLTGLLTVTGAATAKEPDAAQSGEHKFEKAVGYYTECKQASRAEFEKIKPYLKAFTDSEIMAETVNDPERFFKLMEIVNDPRTFHVMANCALEPVMWNTWLRGMMDWPKLMRASVKMMKPEGMAKWMMAPMNPRIWGLMMAHMDPNRYVRWGAAFTNANFYKPLTSFFDPSWYEPRLSWFVDPNTYAPFYQALQVPGLSAAPEKSAQAE
ncbi:hypothetical protein [Thermopetrobacter sp. TC1]|uniref:hypothetical protein n=1 Tax=Thermopetrobacter sp. TC1 TaxID=1495045 RepID=UPI0012E042C1|nr:hypothetical protein [Thermopetrobacter sp. TC1]